MNSNAKSNTLSMLFVVHHAAGDLDSARYYEAEKPGSRELYDGAS
jgi:hypothetical protein